MFQKILQCAMMLIAYCTIQTFEDQWKRIFQKTLMKKGKKASHQDFLLFSPYFFYQTVELPKYQKPSKNRGKRRKSQQLILSTFCTPEGSYYDMSSVVRPSSSNFFCA